MENEMLGTIIVGAIILFVIVLMVKEFLSEWEGKLVDKKEVYETDEDGYSQKKRKLIFETTEGKKKTAVVNRKTYNSAIIGDKYFKKKGSFKPKKA